MQAIETGVQAVGAEVVRLEVAVDNQMALSFYEKLGFIAVGELPGYYPTGTDAIVMQKPLNL
jgi:ribosomal protein S18 acetylase RimI-like enzyme